MKHDQPGSIRDVLFAEDLAGIFRVSVSQARHNLAAGIYGPRFKLGKRYGILRTELLAHLEAQSHIPADDAAPSPIGTKTIRLIRTHRSSRSLEDDRE